MTMTVARRFWVLANLTAFVWLGGNGALAAMNSPANEAVLWKSETAIRYGENRAVVTVEPGKAIRLGARLAAIE